jgi:aspartyl/asparaginyl-tRNA synthetase
MSTVAAGATTARRVKTSEAKVSDEQVSIKGWVRTVRKQKTLAFVEVNDGSNMSGIQCVLPFDSVDEDTMKGKHFFVYIFQLHPECNCC